MKIATYFSRLILLVFIISLVPLKDLPAQQGKWQRTNIGGGGAMNAAASGPTGTIVVGTDLGGAYIKRSSDEQWHIIGAKSGVESTHITNVAFHPTDPDVIFLSAEGGIYRSLDEGNSFALVAGGDRRVFQHIAVSVSNPQIVYASVTPRYNSVIDRNGNLTAALMRSNDGGLNFEYVVRPQDSNNISPDIEIIGAKIIIHPTDPNLVVLLSTNTRFIDITEPGVFTSADGGKTWRDIGNDIEPTDFVFHPSPPYYAYLAYKIPEQGNAGVKASADVANDVWHSVFDTSSFPTGDDPHLVLWPQADSNNPTLIRALNIYTSWYHGLPRQAAWRISNRNGAADLDAGWAAEELGNVEQWAGDAENWRFGWSKLHSIVNPGSASWATTIGFDLSNSDKLYWVTSQFVFSFNDGKNGSESLSVENLATRGSENTGWRSTGIDNITPFILEINRADADVIYAGLNDIGCSVSRDGGSSWKLCIHDTDSWPGITGHSYGGVVTALASDPQNAKSVWMFAAGDQGQPVTPYSSNNYGDSWTPGSTIGIGQTNKIYGMSVDPTSPAEQRRLFVTIDGGVYRSDDHGNSWHQVFDCNQGCRVTSVDPSNGYIFAGGEKGLFVSKVNGDVNTWQTVLSEITIGGFNRGRIFHRGGWGGVSAIAIDENNPGLVLAAVFQNDSSQGVYRCDISSTVVQNQNCELILDNVAYIRDVAIDPSNSDRVYVSSSSAYTSGGFDPASGGIYRTLNDGIDWKQVNEGLEWPMAIPIAINPKKPSKVFIGSPGGGNYWRDFGNSSSVTYGDGIVDVHDNCTQTANTDQHDTNRDGVGNFCDPDLDGNLTVNAADFILLRNRLNNPPGSSCCGRIR
ncbi:MAG: thrombospondin type 3 repeat-containing protein [Methylococcales bacterium]